MRAACVRLTHRATPACCTPGTRCALPPCNQHCCDRQQEGPHLEVGRRLVHEVDRFVGQEAVGDVAVAELRRSHQRTVRYLDSVMTRVALLQAPQDLYCVGHRGLAHQHLHGGEWGGEGGNSTRRELPFACPPAACPPSVWLPRQAAQQAGWLAGWAGAESTRARTCWKRRSNAASFSTCSRYSSSVVAPMRRSSPRASIGLSRLAASIAPSALPAPKTRCTSSTNKMTCKRGAGGG